MSLEPQLRQASLTALLIDLLGLWARERPLLLVLEDAQWLDSLSWEVALQAARGLTDRPVLLALALRSPAELPADHPYYRLRRLPQYGAVQLGPLNAGETSALAAARLGVAGMAPALTNLIWQRTSGNPFVVEELVLSLRDSGALQIADGQATLSADPRELRLPDTVQGLVLSRLDRLPAEAQLTLKVASVIGQTFGLPVLRDVYPEQQVREQIPAHLERLGAADMVLTLDEPTTLRSHEFKQAIIHEVTYRTVLHTQRRALHQRVAHWYEQRAAEQGDLVPLLAFHWRQAEDRERELHYATLAARRLAAEYANSEALSYLTRALQLSDDPEEEYALRWSRMQIQERIGNRDGQRDDLAALEALAAAAQHTDHMAQVANAWAALYRDTSDYPAAIAALERALAIARAAGDHTSAARSMTIWGQVMEYQGAYDEARTYIEQALAIYRQIDYRRGVATNLSGLGNICYYQGDYGAARRYDEEALTIRRAIGDRPSEATTLINLGQVSLQIGEVDAARGYIEQALPLAVAIGDRRSEGLALNTLGSIALARAGYVEALQHLERARQIFRVLGDRRLDANCLVSIGLVWRDVGDDARAQGFFEEALAIQHEIGDESLAAYGHLNLAYAQRHSDPQAALEGFAQALALAQHTGNRDAEAFALNYRAMLFEEQAQWEAAAADYHAALPMLVELQAAAAAIECTAGLARAALQEGRIAEARAHIAECIDYLTANGVEGMEFPIQLYLSCYDTLRAAGEDKLAAELLAEARRLLMDRAEQIDNPAMRASFLEHVAAHRRLLAEWEQLRSTR
jgi:tetratricopeptide (TPR) repeat protein